MDTMPPRALGILIALATTPVPAQPALPQILSRVAEEAEVFQQNLPNSLTREVLVQRTELPPARFRPRIGAGALAPLTVRTQTREIVSEYTIGPLTSAPGSNLVEWRQVVEVDGRSIRSPEAARQSLTLNLKTPDEKLRKRMLEEFVHYGLVDVATDYGLILLAFNKRGLAKMDCMLADSAWIGAEEAVSIAWKQKSAESGELAFRGRQVTHTPLEGLLWVRASDGLPLRVQMWAEFRDSKRVIRDEASVDYVMSPHGFITPASVLHRHVVDGRPITENLYRYDAFRLFRAETELKFTDIPEMPGSDRKTSPDTKK